jgi:KDO2-lipid IV(A) lauroyltransferase
MTVGAEARATTGRRPRRSLRVAVLDGLVWLAPRLPRRLLVAAASTAGEVRYRLRPAAARRARRNLGRVAAWLAANDLGPPAARAAAHDPRALERLVRAAFRHHARYYVEMVLSPSLTPSELDRRLTVSDPALVAEALRPNHAAILVGLHFGAIELPALLVRARTGTATVTPMEDVGDEEIQAWIVRTRGSVGIRLVGLREARRQLAAALRRGETVGLVADRDVTRGGIEVDLFGAPARLPIGPALLALEFDVPVYVGAVRRVGHGAYHGDLVALGPPPPGTRREQVQSIVEAEARAFERLIAVAPEQWWALFSPIWPDLESTARPQPAEPEAAA